MQFKMTNLTKGRHQLELCEPFMLHSGERLEQLECVFETYGQLNAERSNAVLIHHALSTSSHVASHIYDSKPGWWQDMVGPGCPIDTQRYFVLCINNLGSCYGSTGPTSIDPLTHKPYQSNFPLICMEDMVKAQCLVLDALGITSCHTVLGASMGGMLSLCMAVHYPKRVKHLVLISTASKSYPMNIALHTIQRDIIQLDSKWAGGFYSKNPDCGFLLARKLGHIYYRNPKEFDKRFLQRQHTTAMRNSVLSYLDYNARSFIKRFDANSYLTLINAMDHFDIANGGKLTDACRAIQASVLIISVDSDRLFPPKQQYDMFIGMKNASVDAQFINYKSQYGHDAFLVEAEKMGEHIQQSMHFPASFPYAGGNGAHAELRSVNRVQQSNYQLPMYSRTVSSFNGFK